MQDIASSLRTQSCNVASFFPLRLLGALGGSWELGLRDEEQCAYASGGWWVEERLERRQRVLLGPFAVELREDCVLRRVQRRVYRALGMGVLSLRSP